jgi:nicotine blue oxidoreductase
MSVAGLVLAAGAGTRFGGPKALVELDGELLVTRAVRLLVDGGCDPVVVVLGACAQQVQDAADLRDVVVAADWESGLGASLRAGLTALSAQACVVALVDQPLVSPVAVARLRAAWEAGAQAAVATYGGQPRNPVLLDARVWPAVAELAVGDRGARDWLRTHPDEVVAVPCDDVSSAFDVDTQADLHAVQRRSPA